MRGVKPVVTTTGMIHSTPEKGRVMGSLTVYLDQSESRKRETGGK